MLSILYYENRVLHHLSQYNAIIKTFYLLKKRLLKCRKKKLLPFPVNMQYSSYLCVLFYIEQALEGQYKFSLCNSKGDIFVKNFYIRNEISNCGFNSIEIMTWPLLSKFCTIFVLKRVETIQKTFVDNIMVKIIKSTDSSDISEFIGDLLQHSYEWAAGLLQWMFWNEHKVLTQCLKSNQTNLTINVGIHHYAREKKLAYAGIRVDGS